MVQLGIGRKDGAEARLPYAQAKVSVVKTDGEFLVIASDLLKYVASHHLAGARHGTEVARAHSTGKIAPTLRKRHLCGRKLKNAIPCPYRYVICGQRILLMWKPVRFINLNQSLYSN